MLLNYSHEYSGRQIIKTLNNARTRTLLKAADTHSNMVALFSTQPRVSESLPVPKVNCLGLPRCRYKIGCLVPCFAVAPLFDDKLNAKRGINSSAESATFTLVVVHRIKKNHFYIYLFFYYFFLPQSSPE